MNTASTASKDHHGQMRYFSLAGNQKDKHVKISLLNCLEYLGSKNFEDKKQQQITKSLGFSRDSALATAKESRMWIKQSFADLNRRRYVKLNKEGYKLNKIKCLSDTLRELYWKTVKFCVNT